VVAIAVLLSIVIVTGGLFILGWSVFSTVVPSSFSIVDVSGAFWAFHGTTTLQMTK